MPSRRTYLAGLAAAIAGCAGQPRPSGTDGTTPTTDGPADPPATPIGSPDGPTPTEAIERLPADDPALDWAVRLPRRVGVPPAVDARTGRLLVAAGETAVGTPTADGDRPGRLYALASGDGSLDWTTPTADPVVRRPVVDDGRVHAVTGYSTGYTGADQRVVAYGPDGERRWATSPRDSFLRIVAAAGGRLFVGTGDDAIGPSGETVFSVGPDGRTAWSREAGDAMAGRVVGDQLLYSGGGVGVAAYGTTTGEERWYVDGGPLGNPTTPVATHGNTCFTEAPERSDHGYPLVARSLADGAELWRYDTAPAAGENFVVSGVTSVPQNVDPLNYEKGVLATEYGGGVAHVRDGRALWSVNPGGDVPDGPVVGDAIYVGDVEGTVFALTASDGSVRWRASLPGRPSLQPLDGGVLATASRGEDGATVALFAPDGTERWRYRTTRRLHEPVVAGGRAYATTAEGGVLAFAAAQ